jgi:hypothetical protein
MDADKAKSSQINWSIDSPQQSGDQGQNEEDQEDNEGDTMAGPFLFSAPGIENDSGLEV